MDRYALPPFGKAAGTDRCSATAPPRKINELHGPRRRADPPDCFLWPRGGRCLVPMLGFLPLKVTTRNKPPSSCSHCTTKYESDGRDVLRPVLYGPSRPSVFPAQQSQRAALAGTGAGEGRGRASQPAGQRCLEALGHPGGATAGSSPPPRRGRRTSCGWS